ncbi:hypothetical protein DFH11DRAFT_11156 [Phellopilus nigrolimitatus]|nr:hypothetical protein DFH11DRAFT_11156 [Phellopilus nigrolimitatus]
MLAIESDILQQIEQLEPLLLSCAQGGDVSLFETRFSTLEGLIARNAHKLSQTAMTIVHATSSRIIILASAFLDFEATSQMYGDSLKEEMDGVINSFNLLDISDSSVPNHEPYPPSSIPFSTPPSSLQGLACNSGSQTPHAQTSILHEWMLENLHDPYPSYSDKDELARRSGSSLKTINQWFCNARRRIGWSTISKRHFGGDNSMMLDCAYRIFVEHVGHLIYSDKIVQDLEGMRKTAERLFGGSDLVKKLDTIPLPKKAVVSRGQKRHLPNDEESITAPAASSDGPSRKRRRGAVQECDDPRVNPKNSVADSPRKRSRSVASSSSSSSSSASSSLSRCGSMTSMTSCSTNSSESSGVCTPSPSPTERHTELPVDLLDGWIEKVSSEPGLISPDQTSTVLSQKRPLSEPEDTLPAPISKRARRSQPVAPPTTRTRVSKRVLKPAPPLADKSPSQLDSPPPALPQLPELPPLSGEHDVPKPSSAPLDSHPQPTEDYSDMFDQLLAQLDFHVPPASLWEETLPCGSIDAVAVELAANGLDAGSNATPFADTGNAAQATPPDAAPRSATDDFFTLLARGIGAAQQDNSEGLQPQPSNAPLASASALPSGSNAPPQQPHQKAISLSTSDLAFLDVLTDIRAPTPLVAPPATSLDPLIPMLDIPLPTQAPPLPATSDLERAAKLERLNALLAEAQKLQQEVFG